MASSAKPNTLASTNDEVMISQLLASGMCLPGVIEIFKDKLCETVVVATARRLILAEPGDENDFSPTPSPTNFLCDLGMDLFRQSPDMLRDCVFVDQHIENLAKDAPDDFIDPIFATIMTDPVVLSSGFIVDRNTALDEVGDLKFKTCPWSRQPLLEEVYSLVALKNRLKEFKVQRLTCMLDTARNLLEVQNIPKFRKVFQISQTFVSEIGCSSKAGDEELTLLGLSVLDMPKGDYSSKSSSSCYPILEPRILAELVNRLYNNKKNAAAAATTSKENKMDECMQKIAMIVIHAWKAIQESRLEEASEWIKACDFIQKNCRDILVGNKEIPVGRMDLELGRKRGDTDLATLQRRVYCELLKKEDPGLISKFLKEEGICANDMIDISPCYLYVSLLHSELEENGWQEATRSPILEGGISHVLVTATNFRDQGWGNTKAKLGLALYDSTDDTMMTRCDVYGTYRSPDYKFGECAYRLLEEDEDIVSKAKPGCYFKLEYIVGGGGGHTLNVDSWECKIFHKEWFRSSPEAKKCYRMHDPEGDAGLYIGPVNNHGVAHGRGRLEYDDGITFIGVFSNGLMEEGTNYRRGYSIHTMKGGRWTPGSHNLDPDEDIVSRYPLDARHNRGIRDDDWNEYSEIE